MTPVVAKGLAPDVLRAYLAGGTEAVLAHVETLLGGRIPRTREARRLVDHQLLVFGCCAADTALGTIAVALRRLDEIKGTPRPLAKKGGARR